MIFRRWINTFFLENIWPCSISRQPEEYPLVGMELVIFSRFSWPWVSKPPAALNLEYSVKVSKQHFGGGDTLQVLLALSF